MLTMCWPCADHVLTMCWRWGMPRTRQLRVLGAMLRTPHPLPRTLPPHRPTAYTRRAPTLLHHAGAPTRAFAGDSSALVGAATVCRVKAGTTLASHGAKRPACALRHPHDLQASANLENQIGFSYKWISLTQYARPLLLCNGGHVRLCVFEVGDRLTTPGRVRPRP